MHDRVARHLAVGRVGDLGLDACAEVAPVLVHSKRHTDLGLALRIQSQCALRGLVVPIPVAALTTLEPIVPPQGGVVRLLVYDPVQLTVGDRLAEVIARLNRDHGVAALARKARGRRHDDFKLGLAILLHLEAAGGLQVTALHAQGVDAECRRRRHREAGIHRAERIHRDLPAEDDLVVGIRGDDFHCWPVELRQRVVMPPSQHGLQVDRVAGPIDGLVGVDEAGQFACRLLQRPRAGIGRRHLLAAAGDADDVFHRLLGERRFEQAISRGRALGDGLLLHDHLDRALRDRFTSEAIGGEEQHLAR